MLLFQPLNAVNGNNSDYSNFEASNAVSHTNGFGGTDGFGSQGLSLYDQIQLGNHNPCASNWCAMFSLYQPGGSPLELQQIAPSDPHDESCGTGGSNCVPGGDSGDLNVWLPFAVNQGVNVVELYSVDADLALDPNFCFLSTTPLPLHCDTASSYGSLTGLSRSQQLDYFQYVGLPVQSGATGNGSYANTVSTEHGYH